MNRKSKNLACAIALLIILYICGRLGTYQWAEEIIYTMPEQTYRAIKQDIGNDATDVQIAEHYIKFKYKYNNISE